MQPTVYQKPEIRDANDNIIQQGAFGKNTALANSTNDGWIDYVANDLEFLYDLAKDEVVPVPSLPASGQTNKTYLLTTTGVSYRWSGTEWVAVSSSEAVGRAESAALLAEQWATKTDGTVDGTEYSAKYYAQQAEQSADDAQDTADDMATHLVQIDKNTGGVSANSKRISNIEKLLQGNLYDYDTDDDSAYTKTVPSGALPYAGIEQIGGKTLVWNQLSSMIASSMVVTSNGVTFTFDSNALTCTLSGTASGSNAVAARGVQVVQGHKYLLKGCPSGGNGSTYYQSVSGQTADTGSGVIFTEPTGGTRYIIITVTNGTNADGLVFRSLLFDLTLMFGSGNEPTTVAEFEAMFPASYYPYNAGTLLSAGVTEVVSVANLLANEALEQGAITTNGDKTPASTRVRTINFIEVKPNTQYEATTLSQGINVLGVYYYDALQSFINRDTPESEKYLFTTGAAVKYLKITYSKTDDTNIVPSDVSPVLLRTVTLPIPAEVQALDGYGWSAGSVYNHIDFERKVFVKCVGSYTFNGTENWEMLSNTIGDGYNYFRFYGANFTSKIANARLGMYFVLSDYIPYHSQSYWHGTDKANKTAWSVTSVYGMAVRDDSYTTASDFKSAMNGKTLYYELATPVETDISAYLTDNLIEVDAGGTITFPNQNGADYHIPVPSDVTYMIDLQEAISNG